MQELTVTDDKLNVPEKLDRPGFQLRKIGINFDSDTVPFEEWEKLGDQLKKCARSCNWWLGDWMNYGERVYGEKYAQAVEVTGLDYQTLANIAWVCANVGLSLRKENLPFSHHALVAKMPIETQRKWLDKAAAGNWSFMDFRAKIKAAKALSVGAAATHSVPVDFTDAILTFRQAALAAAEEMPPAKWDKEALTKVCNLFYGAVADVEDAFSWTRERWQKYVAAEAKRNEAEGAAPAPLEPEPVPA